MREAWSFKPHSNPLNAFSHLIARSRVNLINWKKSGLNPIESEIKKTEQAISKVEDLEDLNGSCTVTLSGLAALYNKMTALQRQNSTKWAQRARLQWIQCGDYNTSFFHNNVRIRNHVNSIIQITNSNGICFTDRIGIESTFINFFLICGLIHLISPLMMFFKLSLMICLL